MSRKPFPRPAALTVANLKKFNKTVESDLESTTLAYGDSVRPTPFEIDDQVSAVDSIRFLPSETESHTPLTTIRTSTGAIAIKMPPIQIPVVTSANPVPTTTVFMTMTPTGKVLNQCTPIQNTDPLIFKVPAKPPQNSIFQGLSLLSYHLLLTYLSHLLCPWQFHQKMIIGHSTSFHLKMRKNLFRTTSKRFPIMWWYPFTSLII